MTSIVIDESKRIKEGIELESGKIYSALHCKTSKRILVVKQLCNNDWIILVLKHGDECIEYYEDREQVTDTYTNIRELKSINIKVLL